ncbi:mandelate racemase/muconate lactonizing enzyme family protein [Clostridium sp. MCC353]|uniref:mandelate racemase/muconate lactonizing enzyme family protein n=1 Tax=Clostridium sp. MCC353 TaxID=2592646 RepID=UPI001C011362|nr:mandelate racemase/muconate lactonizing enzyme family protein [Clostridium sp. MCC353]MBT9780020.1 mandelate racemase/muconate lactonizing enzyme family protein [Clostridium sp. MCC353]
MYKKHSDFGEYRAVSSAELDQVLESEVLDLRGLDQPVIIESIELLFNCGQYFVRTVSKDGLTGISVTNDRVRFCYPILQQQIAPYFIGKDARDLERLLDEVYVYESNYKLAGIPYFACLSFLELSILDLLAKAKEVSLGRLFGERIHDYANVYVASGNRHTTPEEELEILRKEVERVGAKAIKYKIGGRMSRNKDSMAGRSEELIYGTRRYFGDDMIIHADGNGSYDVETAVRYGRVMEEINGYFYEEPCPFDDLWATKAVRDSLDIPLAFGEQETSMRRFKWLVEHHGTDVIQPDILYNGGLIRTTKVAKMAQLAGMTVTPHVSTGFCFVYILHLSSYTPNIGKYQENKKGFEITNELLDGQLTLADGRINIPDSVGIGIRENHEIIKKALQLFIVK